MENSHRKGKPAGGRGAGVLFGPCAALFLAMVPGVPSAQAVGEAVPDRFDTALQAYERCHWNDAFAQFAGLADAGHPAAARIAILMQAHGPRLFAARFGVAADRRMRLLDGAAREHPTGHRALAQGGRSEPAWDR